MQVGAGGDQSLFVSTPCFPVLLCILSGVRRRVCLYSLFSVLLDLICVQSDGLDDVVLVRDVLKVLKINLS